MKKCCEKQRNDFAKEVLDCLDEVVRGTPALFVLIAPFKEAIRRLRDRKKEKKSQSSSSQK